MSLKVSVVSYINSYPFVYGLMNNNTNGAFNMHLCPPSECAADVFKEDADVALVPAGALNMIDQNYTLFDDFCIGAEKSVASVLLLSNTPLQEIKHIFLDTHSITTVKLTKVLARYHWKIYPEYQPVVVDNCMSLQKGEALLAIGDKCFEIRNNYSYVNDMFDEWHAFSSLPFVFAVWVIRNNVSAEQRTTLAQALKFGMEHKQQALETLLPHDKKKDFNYYLSYLTENISYCFDDKKEKALTRYLELIKKLP